MTTELRCICPSRSLLSRIPSVGDFDILRIGEGRPSSSLPRSVLRSICWNPICWNRCPQARTGIPASTSFAPISAKSHRTDRVSTFAITRSSELYLDWKSMTQRTQVHCRIDPKLRYCPDLYGGCGKTATLQRIGQRSGIASVSPIVEQSRKSKILGMPRDN